MNNNMNNWKWYLIAIPLFFIAMALTGQLNPITAVVVGVGFMIMSAVSYHLSHRKAHHPL